MRRYRRRYKEDIQQERVESNTPGRGRPRGRRSMKLVISLPIPLVALIDQMLQRGEARTRSNAIRQCVESLLEG